MTPGDEARDIASANAIDCGYAGHGASRTPVIDCIEGAITTGEPVVGGWARIGIDSEVRSYVATTRSAARMLVYDSDPSGGDGACESLVAERCSGPLVRMPSPPDGDLFVCESSGERRTLCGD